VVEIDDCVRGTVLIENSELDDLIIYRSDGTPTYNFTVVVDDWDMRVTHVIRGDDHLNNTPRQINILKALNAHLPIYAHLPMILGADGKRLSKRHGAVSVQYYREEGILPEALLNYIVRLGWSHGDQEIFSLEEMIEFFDIHDINKSGSAFNHEKLLWLNQHYMKAADIKRLTEIFKGHLQSLDIDLDAEAKTTEDFEAKLETVVSVQRERVKTLKEMAEQSLFFFQDKVEFDDEAKAKYLTADIMPALAALRTAFENISDAAWQKENIHQAIVATAEQLGLKMGKIAQPLRVALTGNTMSPSIDITCALIGKKRVLQRFFILKSSVHDNFFD
jgi:glutamyl-tRNA synthetase